MRISCKMEKTNNCSCNNNNKNKNNNNKKIPSCKECSPFKKFKKIEDNEKLPVSPMILNLFI